MKVTIETHEVITGPVLKTTTVEFTGEHAQWQALDYLLGQATPSELLEHAQAIITYANEQMEYADEEVTLDDILCGVPYEMRNGKAYRTEGRLAEAQ